MLWLESDSLRGCANTHIIFIVSFISLVRFGQQSYYLFLATPRLNVIYLTMVNKGNNFARIDV